MTTQDEIRCKGMPASMNATADAEFEHWWKIRLVMWSAISGVAYPVIGLCLGIWSYCTGSRFDYIYGECFPFTFALLSFFWFAVIGLSWFLATVKPKRPVRTVREVIGVLALLFTAFGLHYLAAYLFGGDDMSFGGVVEGFYGRMTFFAMLVIVMLPISVSFVFPVGWFLDKIYNRSKHVKRGKPLKWSWLTRKVEGFLGRHQSLVLSGLKEYCLLGIRYSVWGAALALLFLEAMIVAYFLVNRPVAISSFAGEKFGRVLSSDVERKKLEKPIGVIDELMLQTEGDPDRRLSGIYGQKYLGGVSKEEADRIAEKTCTDLQNLLKVELRKRPPTGRDEHVKGFVIGNVYTVVSCNDYFFQKGKMLRLYVGLFKESRGDPRLNVTEVMGYKIGVPISGNGKPRKPFWKFERIVNQCMSDNNIVDGVYAVHDVSALSREEAIQEFEEARKAVERLHGITMFKSVDYDDAKAYDYNGHDITINVKLEYMHKKQIRYSVVAEGDWLEQIHAMPPVGSERRQIGVLNTAAFCLCVVVLCCGALMLMRHRNRKNG